MTNDGQLRLFWLEDVSKPGFYIVPNLVIVTWNGKTLGWDRCTNSS